MRQATAALRDFDPAYVRFGSIATEAVEAHARLAPKADKIAGRL
jgi:hypothetical protein